jgi:hypothetical protein
MACAWVVSQLLRRTVPVTRLACHCCDVIIMVLSLLIEMLYFLPSSYNSDAHCIHNNVRGSSTDQSHPHIVIHRRLPPERYAWHYDVRHTSRQLPNPHPVAGVCQGRHGAAAGGHYASLCGSLRCPSQPCAPIHCAAQSVCPVWGVGPARVAVVAGTGCITPWDRATIFKRQWLRKAHPHMPVHHHRHGAALDDVTNVHKNSIIFTNEPVYLHSGRITREACDEVRRLTVPRFAVLWKAGVPLPPPDVALVCRQCVCLPHVCVCVGLTPVQYILRMHARRSRATRRFCSESAGRTCCPSWPRRVRRLPRRTSSARRAGANSTGSIRHKFYKPTNQCLSH